MDYRAFWKDLNVWAKGDTDRVITLMGTLLSMEGGYEFEGGAGGSSKEGRCAD